jgi:hypothetical protein
MTPRAPLLRGYRWLLRGYPEQFRRRFEREMLLDAQAGLDAATTKAERLRVLVRLGEDLIVNVPAEWLRHDRIRVAALAAFIHVTSWMIVVVISWWQWPDAPSAIRVVGLFSGLALICVACVAARQHSLCERRISLRSV